MSVIRQFEDPEPEGARRTQQLSLLGFDAAAPTPADLAGLLAGRGQITRTGETAQVSVVVDHPWRAAVLVGECARRGIGATSVSTIDDHIGVRTAFSPLLAPLAESWLSGLAKRAPRGLLLSGGMLRLWVEAGGRFEGSGVFTLALDRGDESHWEALGAALATVGIVAQLSSPRGQGGASYRIVGRRRLDRLAEMVGDPPRQAPAGFWPS